MGTALDHIEAITRLGETAIGAPDLDSVGRPAGEQEK